MLRHINKSIASGQVQAPPSKSYAHRLLIGAALCDNDVVVENIELSNDIIATIKCITSLGKKVIYDEISRTITITKGSTENNLFDCNESGSTLRFFIPIVIALKQKGLFIGTKRLMERGLGIYEEIFNTLGIKYEKSLESIEVFGSLVPYRYLVKGNISSQFITGLLFALPLLNGNSYINITTTLESANYIDITLDVLRLTGIEVVNIDNRYIIKAPQEYLPAKFSVEGDYSNASFLDAFNYLGGNVELIGLKEQSMQGDKIYKKYFNIISKGYATIDLQNAIDLGPILFVMASLFHGAHFINTNRLKIKESNRISDLQQELNKFGIELKELDNEVFINKQEINFPTEVLDGHNDHRIVMALTVLLSTTGGKIVGVEAVSKSYPTFFEDISNLGIEVRKC
jgi:3-phosphoshikimate 1-carboxyvinyltransferase